MMAQQLKPHDLFKLPWKVKICMQWRNAHVSLFYCS